MVSIRKSETNRVRDRLLRQLRQVFTKSALAEFLFGTGESVLVEASPYDDVSGRETSHGRPANPESEQLVGQNLLDFALIETRDRLKTTMDL